MHDVLLVSFQKQQMSTLSLRESTTPVVVLLLVGVSVCLFLVVLLLIVVVFDGVLLVLA